jgi:hypothetical protein
MNITTCALQKNKSFVAQKNCITGNNIATLACLCMIKSNKANCPAKAAHQPQKGYYLIYQT